MARESSISDINRDLDDIEDRFTYHPPPDRTTVETYKRVRANARQLAEELVMLCPPSRERSLALTKLEEAVMHANSAIARHGVRSQE